MTERHLPPINTSWANQPVTVLGLSKSGAAVARYIQRRGGQVFLSETVPATPGNEALRQELQALGIEIEMGGHTAKVYSHSNLVVTSPGIPPTGSILEELKISGKEIISEVELAYREMQKPENHNAKGPIPIIGITGTNGKSTTVSLISDLLTHGGLNAPACGNIGLPLLTVLDDACDHKKPLDALVAELSSFQLEFSPTLKTKIAVFTNLRPDHLDWHGSLDAYQNAKLKLFSGKQSPDYAIVNADDPFSKTIVANTQGNVLGFSTEQAATQPYAHQAYLEGEKIVVAFQDKKPPVTLFNVRDLYLIGRHNYENMLASVSAALLMTIPPKQITETCLNFKGLEHRLEKVAPANSPLVFYNDSKATNPDSSISALKAFDRQKVVLIAGGYDKMTPLDEFVEEVKQHAHAVVLLGKARERFQAALVDGGFNHISLIETPTDQAEAALEAAIEQAMFLAQESKQPSPANPSKPYPILFSPACASFDMFKNYEERGRAFKQAVETLINTPLAKSR